MIQIRNGFLVGPSSPNTKNLGESDTDMLILCVSDYSVFIKRIRQITRFLRSVFSFLWELL